jgi:hypothetical protein
MQHPSMRDNMAPPARTELKFYAQVQESRFAVQLVLILIYNCDCFEVYSMLIYAYCSSKCDAA